MGRTSIEETSTPTLIMILRVMIIIIVNEGLKVADLDLLLAAFALNQRVQLEEHPVTIVKR